LNKQQTEELVSQIQVFLGMGLLSLLVAAINWSGHANGGWGNAIDWIGRSISSLLVIGVGSVLVRKRRIAWFIVPILLVMLWIAFALASIAWSYTVFVGIFILFLVYSILLCAYYLWSNRTGRVSPRLDKIINRLVYGRQTIWSALLLVGTITTWSEIRKRISGGWPDVVLVVCLIVVGILIYAWQSSIRQDK
jgi:hypothetical protein